LAKAKLDDKAIQPEAKMKAIAKALSGLYSVEAEKTAANQVRHQKDLVLLPFPISKYPPEESFKSLSEALDGFYSKHILLEKSRENQAVAEAKVSKVQANLDQVLEAMKKFEETDKSAKEKADLIYAHYSAIEEVVGVMKKAVSLKMQKKDIMYKMKLAGEKGLIPKDFVKDVDLKKKKLILNIK
jgi:predicted ribosome quality control (RQC) complex YloA/Tae2 family protein